MKISISEEQTVGLTNESRSQLKDLFNRRVCESVGGCCRGWTCSCRGVFSLMLGSK